MTPPKATSAVDGNIKKHSRFHSLLRDCPVRKQSWWWGESWMVWQYFTWISHRRARFFLHRVAALLLHLPRLILGWYRQRRALSKWCRVVDVELGVSEYCTANVIPNCTLRVSFGYSCFPYLCLARRLLFLRFSLLGLSGIWLCIMLEHIFHLFSCRFLFFYFKMKMADARDIFNPCIRYLTPHTNLQGPQQW